MPSIPLTFPPHIPPLTFPYPRFKGYRSCSKANEDAHIPSHWSTRLLVILLSLVVDDVEELELVDTLGGGDDTEPVTELHLLEELLGAKYPRVWSAGIHDCRVVVGKRTGT